MGSKKGNRVESFPGFYTFVRHLGKMGPPSSLLFLTVNGGGGGTQDERHRVGSGKEEEGQGERKKIRKETVQEVGLSSPTSSSSATSAKAQRSRSVFVLLIKERKESKGALAGTL